MLPPDQRLEAAYLAIRRPGERLVVNDQLIVGDALAKVARQVAPFTDGVVHLALEEAIDAATALLGPIEGHVRIGHQGLGSPAVVGIQADAEAGPHGQFLTVERHRRGQHLDQTARQLRGYGGLITAGDLDDDELVAAQARGEGRCLHGRLKTARGLDQQGVARQVSVLVVGFLEVVQIDADDRQALAGRLDPIDGGGQAHLQRVAVGQSGETVMLGEVADFLFGRSALAQVPHGQDRQARGFDARPVVHQARKHLDRDFASADQGPQAPLTTDVFTAGTGLIEGQDLAEERASDQLGERRAHQVAECGVGVVDPPRLHHHQAFIGRVGEATDAFERRPGGLGLDRDRSEPPQNDHARDRADGQGQHAAGQKLVGHRDRGVWNDGDRRHAGEMQHDDAQAQQTPAQRLATDRPRRARQQQGRSRATDPEDGRHADRGVLPHQLALGHEGRHAHIVHGGHAEPDQNPAREIVRGAALRRRDSKTAGHEQRCNHQRQERACRAVAGLETWRERDHGDEVGGPDAGSRDQAGQQQPSGPDDAPSSAHARVKTEGRKATRQTDGAGDKHQPQVMLRRQTGQQLEHATFLEGHSPLRLPEELRINPF